MGTPSDTEATELARRLHGLREGSGRSYGSLARRVGVSASTLHRYCSGSTVPAEFAPVERLARLCGCTGGDLIALHRLWVGADTARRERMEAGPAGIAPAPSAPAAEDAASAPWSASAVVGDGPSAPVAASPAADEAVAASEPASAVAGNAPAATGPPATAVGEAPPGPGGPRTPLRPSAAEPPRGRARRARMLYAATGGAAAVLAFVLILAFDHSPLAAGGPPAAVSSRTPGGAAPAAQPQPRTSATPTASGPRPSTTPSPSASASVSGDALPGPGRPGKSPASTTPRPAPAAGLPFTWSVDQHVWEGGCGHSYLLDRRPSAVPPPPVQADAEPWARSLGAVHAGDTQVRVTVQGRGGTTVVLQSLQVRVVARNAPPAGEVYRMDGGCGGSLTPRRFAVDLDVPRPVAHPRAGNDAGTPIPAVSFPYRVSARDPEILLTTARTTACDCAWYLELAWTAGGRSGTVRIDDAGRPFRTSGHRGRTAYGYDTEARRWLPETADGTAEARANDRQATEDAGESPQS
ncbi:helix-turn-helix domain-containing protein [Streptomyces sp. NPDC060194]|uniref:helix-turn-helix domain-containing protein n=1 Tax=Streptomyces sp. NPDC060194 TaxID=3347069 RepID=UPI0036588BE6